MWDLAESFEVFLKPIRKFCVEEIKDRKLESDLNDRHLKVLKKTIRLIDKYYNVYKKFNDYSSYKIGESEKRLMERAGLGIKNDNAYEKVWEHIGRNINDFWY